MRPDNDIGIEAAARKEVPAVNAATGTTQDAFIIAEHHVEGRCQRRCRDLCEPVPLTSQIMSLTRSNRRVAAAEGAHDEKAHQENRRSCGSAPELEILDDRKH